MGHLNSFLSSGGGNLNKNFPKIQMPGGFPRGGGECCTGKNNRFPILDILGHLKNTHKNPKFGRVRQIPIWELGWEFPDWYLSHSPKFGIFVGIL